MTKREFDAEFQSQYFIVTLHDIGAMREAYVNMLDAYERDRKIKAKYAAKWYLPNRLIILRAKVLGRPNPFSQRK